MSIQRALQKLDEKKITLDSYRPLSPDLINNLNEWYKIELTYTSNALEGNTLTSSETALVVEKGITVGGKTLQEHLEAINHAFAFDYILELAQSNRQDITVHTILMIHQLILKKIDDKNAGKFRTINVRIKGSDVVFPHAIKVPELMDEFIHWLHTVDKHPVLIACEAHFKFVSIHPFADGNGRTARLLMNLLLLQTGYPVAVIRPELRKEYIDALEHGQKTGDLEPFYIIIMQAVDKSFDTYLKQVA